MEKTRVIKPNLPIKEECGFDLHSAQTFEPNIKAISSYTRVVFEYPLFYGAKL